MTEALPGTASFSVFLIASVILAATPGPGVLFILARTVAALGAIFVLLAMCTDLIHSVAAVMAHARLARINTGSRFGSYAAAGVYASLGLYAAFSGTSGAK